MSNETTENFLKVMAEFEWPENKPVSYRLYYNEDGSPKCYTMDDLPGKYIQVDRETYINHVWNVKVVDNNLVIIPLSVTVQKLVQDTERGTPCHPKDITVVVDPEYSHTKWSIKKNEIS